MSSNIYREKAINAILFFAQKTRFLNMTKLFKLLHFFDFRHFKETGYPAIGLEYFAFDRGPVPKKLWLQVKDGAAPEDFTGRIVLVPKRDELNPAYREIEFKAKCKPDLSIFTPREKRILDELVFLYKDIRAGEISEISHLPKQPWKITRDTKGQNAYIDYMLAIDNEALVDQEEAEESLREHFEVLKNFDLEPVK